MKSREESKWKDNWLNGTLCKFLLSSQRRNTCRKLTYILFCMSVSNKRGGVMEGSKLRFVFRKNRFPAISLSVSSRALWKPHLVFCQPIFFKTFNASSVWLTCTMIQHCPIIVDKQHKGTLTLYFHSLFVASEVCSSSCLITDLWNFLLFKWWNHSWSCTSSTLMNWSAQSNETWNFLVETWSWKHSISFASSIHTRRFMLGR